MVGRLNESWREPMRVKDFLAVMMMVLGGVLVVSGAAAMFWMDGANVKYSSVSILAGVALCLAAVNRGFKVGVNADGVQLSTATEPSKKPKPKATTSPGTKGKAGGRPKVPDAQEHVPPQDLDTSKKS